MSGDLPEELVAEARAVFREWLKLTEYDRRACFEYDELLQAMIARALRARDERAARIAREHDGDGSETNVGHVIALAILNPEQKP